VKTSRKEVVFEKGTAGCTFGAWRERAAAEANRRGWPDATGPSVGILNYCRTKMCLRAMEAFNGNIKALLRYGRGYSDLRPP